MTIEKKSAMAMGWISLGFLLFHSLIIDATFINSGWWVSVLLSIPLTLPAMLSMHRIERSAPGKAPCDALLSLWGSVPGRGYLLLTAAFLLFIGTVSLSMLLDISSYIALSGIHAFWRNAVTVGAVALCCLSGLRGVAGMSRIRLLTLPIFLLVIVCVQWSAFEPRWLLPLLGDGLPAGAKAALPLSALQMLLIPLWMISGSCRSAAGIQLRALLTVLAGVLLFSMMSPVMPYAPHSRFFRLDTLFSNGRSSLSLQMIFMVVFYYGMSVACCFCLSASAALLHRVFPALREKWCSLGGGAAELALLYTPVSDPSMLFHAAPWCLIALSAPLVLLAMSSLLREKKKVST